MSRNPLVLGFLLLAAVSFHGCRSSENKEEHREEVAEPSAGVNDINSVESELFAMILGEFRDGVFRGISFGDTREKVKLTETFEVFEESDSLIGYTHDTQQLETVDVYYLFSPADRNVEKIVVDIFLNSKGATDKLWLEAKHFYDKKFGKEGESTAGKTVWQKDKVKVVLENVANGIDNGLKITFSPTDRTLLSLS